MKSIEITWYGTASLSVKTEASKVLIDPFLTLWGSENHSSMADFAGYDNILLTHGHVDHIYSIPKLMKKNEEAAVFCTETPAEVLEKKGVPGERVMLIKPGNRMKFGDIQVRVLKGKHIQFDKELRLHTLVNLRMIRYVYNVPLLMVQNHICREEGETVAYLLEAHGKTILVLGSLGLSQEEAYPQEPDILVLPYQGATDLVSPALELIDRIKPKAVILDHFDNAFPPVSSTVDTRRLKRALSKRYPALPVVKPKAGKSVILHVSV